MLKNFSISTWWFFFVIFSSSVYCWSNWWSFTYTIEWYVHPIWYVDLDSILLLSFFLLFFILIQLNLIQFNFFLCKSIDFNSLSYICHPIIMKCLYWCLDCTFFFLWLNESTMMNYESLKSERGRENPFIFFFDLIFVHHYCCCLKRQTKVFFFFLNSCFIWFNTHTQ